MVLEIRKGVENLCNFLQNGDATFSIFICNFWYFYYAINSDKSYLGERSMRVYHDEPAHSKIFIEFVALIIRNKIYTCLKDRMKELHKKKNYMTVPAALKELDKIELIRQADGTYILDHAVTATQKDILQAFNLTAANVRKEAVELGKRLSVLTN